METVHHTHARPNQNLLVTVPVNVRHCRRRQSERTDLLIRLQQRHLIYQRCIHRSCWVSAQVQVLLPTKTHRRPVHHKRHQCCRHIQTTVRLTLVTLVLVLEPSVRQQTLVLIFVKVVAHGQKDHLLPLVLVARVRLLHVGQHGCTQHMWRQPDVVLLVVVVIAVLVSHGVVVIILAVPRCIVHHVLVVIVAVLVVRRTVPTSTSTNRIVVPMNYIIHPTACFVHPL